MTTFDGGATAIQRQDGTWVTRPMYREGKPCKGEGEFGGSAGASDSEC